MRQLMQNGRIPMNPEDHVHFSSRHSDSNFDDTKRLPTHDRLVDSSAKKTAGVLESDEFFEPHDHVGDDEESDNDTDDNSPSHDMSDES